MKVIKRKHRDKVIIELLSLIPVDEQFCEITLSEKDLSVHHIIPRRKGGNDDSDNLMVLNRKVHDMIDGKIKADPIIMEIYSMLLEKRKHERAIRTLEFNIEKTNERIKSLRNELKT